MRGTKPQQVGHDMHLLPCSLWHLVDVGIVSNVRWKQNPISFLQLFFVGMKVLWNHKQTVK